MVFCQLLETESKKDTRSPVRNAYCLEHVVFCRLSQNRVRKRHPLTCSQCTLSWTRGILSTGQNRPKKRHPLTCSQCTLSWTRGILSTGPNRPLKMTPANVFTMHTVLNTWYFVDQPKPTPKNDTRQRVHDGHCLEHVVFCGLFETDPKSRHPLTCSR